MQSKRQGLLAHTQTQGFLIAACSLALYVLTMPPGLLWGGGDFARYQTGAYLGSLDGEVSVLSHYLWIVFTYPIVHLVPLHDPAWRANFATAVYAALALWFVYATAVRLTGFRLGAALAAATLAISHTFWTYAVMPKVYSLNCLLLAACCYYLVLWRAVGQVRWLGLAAMLYGLSFLNHVVMAVNGPALALFALLTLAGQATSPGEKARAIGVAVGGFLIGLAPLLVLLAIPQAPNTTHSGVTGTIADFLVALTRVALDPAAWAVGVGWAIALGGYQFFFAAVAGIMGAIWFWRRDRAAFWLVMLSLLGTFLFLLAATYGAVGGPYIWNLHYYLQTYVPFALLIAGGLAALCERRPDWFALPRVAALAAALLLVPITVYALAPVAARPFLADIPDFRPLPGRDNLVYVLSPWKQQETGARLLGERVLDYLPPDSTYIADYSIWAVIRYLMVVENQRPDIRLVLLEGDQAAVVAAADQGGPLFLADTYRYYDLAAIERTYTVEPAGPAYRLLRKQP